MSKKILFFGNERLATGVSTTAPSLQALVAAGYEVAAVVVAQNPIGKSRRGRLLEVAEIAEEHNIPLLSPADLIEARDQMAGFGAEAAVLVAYGKIVPAAILDLFPRGIINVHPSLLPCHRGPSPIESSILDGDDKTGVSLMRLASKMDSGPIYDQRTTPLKGAETKQDLADRLAAIGAEMVLEYLPKVLDGSAEPLPQDESGATHDDLITKADNRLDWAKPAVRLEREVRAYAGWPGSRTTLGSTDVIITETKIVDYDLKPSEILVEGKKLIIGTGKQALEIQKLKPAGKKEMPAAAFLAGYKLN